MPITTLKVLASLLQLHGPDATIQSDHEGIAALLNDLRADRSEQATQVAFRRGALRRGRMRARIAKRDMRAARARFAEAALYAVTD
jgi:hypothetical protein